MKLYPIILRIIPFLFFILILWPLILFIRVTNNDVYQYKEKSKWMKIENLKFIENNRDLGFSSQISLLFQDTISQKYYLLISYPEYRGEIFYFNINVNSVNFFINEDNLNKGSSEYPIPVLNYTIHDDLRDQLAETKYFSNVKKYLRFDKNNKYIPVKTTKSRTRILLYAITLSITISILGMGYYIYSDKKTLNI